MEQVEGIDVVIVSKVDNAIERMALDVVEGGVPLMDSSVLDVVAVARIIADEMSVHDSCCPEYVSSLHGGGFHLYHDPEKGRGNEPQGLA